MPHEVRNEPAIAVLLPCYNEELTIGEVVRRFRETLSSATVYVYDNNSKDLTALRARAAGAVVVREPRQGKGNVVRRMFADIDADIYVMADGDGTYAPEDAPQLINTLLTERSDMVVGTRRGVTDDAGRSGHAFGNRIFNRLYKGLFGADFTDIFSGYRVFSRRFVKSFPAVSGGFEIETEMSVHASQLKLPVNEMALDYGRRPEGSSSKLSTFRDGARILWMFAMLVKETQPLRFFGTFALFFLAASIGLMIPVLIEFAETGLVPRMPTWVLSVGLLLLSMLAMVTGLILDSVSRGRAEQKRIFYLSIPAGRIERRAGFNGEASPKREPGKASRAA
ncbi:MULTISPECIES: glycosyltransferase [unclassified Mesorhizobium]|uniref:glycosyltransferase n=3 Tax=Mesorhizobium TaxID=68287 RepID=UPI000F75E0AD|nr:MULTISPECIES: glycosyltransferase [unclassified Mesorhizobium]TGV94531.1 glycosyltransferase [Mesorhizobium sp. M00.F.Ca.ET.158.01.1.1]AZO60365.1 glycosyltransferase [Mesorhizobium sp. M1A.F.Ca.IN.022.06.1.1]MCT2576091.1 glycosyltransferase [Mesorhizobium sp. P13.3]MDF3164977.1 glycosyltransferase [Mesorhizobium sp. P16.1]MDF3176610.1 glycosyltransferase [Mesorhizobium sp. P17.1]